jgi:hypothetical protein
MKNIYTFILFFFVLINCLFSQIGYEKSINIGLKDFCYDVKRIGDYNYLIGTTSNINDNLDYNNLMIVKVDNSGNAIWKKVFYDFQLLGKSNFQSDINQTNDLVITGPIYTGKNEFDFGILFSIIDTSGIVKVIKTLGEGIGETILSIDDGYLVVSYDKIIKTNLNGKIDWRKITTENDQFHGRSLNSATKSLDTNIFIVGEIGYNVKNINNILIVEFDTKGNIDWMKCYSSNSLNFFPNKIIQTSDSGLIVTGYSVQKKIGFDLPRPLFVMRTDKRGEILWSKSYEFSETTDVAYDIIETNDKSLIVSGAINKYGANEDLLLMKIDSSGELLWSKSFGSNLYDEGRAIISTDNGYLTVGFTGSYIDNYDFFLIQFNNNTGGANDTTNLLKPKIYNIAISIDIPDSVFKIEDSIISDYIIYKKTESMNNNTFNIFPNPINDFVHINNLKTQDNYIISIFNLYGNKVFEKEIRNSENANFNLESLKAGLYLMEILTNNLIESFKIIKE